MNDRDDLEQLIGDRDPGMVKGGPPRTREEELALFDTGNVRRCDVATGDTERVFAVREGGERVELHHITGDEALALVVRGPLPRPATYRCAGPSCPGLPYRASEMAHPASCAAPLEAENGPPPVLPYRFTFDTDAGGLHPTSTSTIALRSYAPSTALIEFGAGNPYRAALTFNVDGTIKVGESVTADEAAAAVVEALRPRFAEMIRQERAALDQRAPNQRALIRLACELERRAEIRQGDPTGEDAARLRAAARLVEDVATGAPTKATVCPLRACSEPHVHGPTGERHNAFDEGACPAPPTDVRPYDPARSYLQQVGEALGQGPTETLLDAARRVAAASRPAPLTEAVAQRWGERARTLVNNGENLALLVARMLLRAARGEIPADVRTGDMYRGEPSETAEPAAPTSGARLSAFERLEAAIGRLRGWPDVREIVDAFDAFTVAREPGATARIIREGEPGFQDALLSIGQAHVDALTPEQRAALEAQSEQAARDAADIAKG